MTACGWRRSPAWPASPPSSLGPPAVAFRTSRDRLHHSANDQPRRPSQRLRADADPRTSPSRSCSAPCSSAELRWRYAPAGLLDATTNATHAAAASAAAQRARAVERERFDALIHDGVIATLLTASRPVRRQNVRALASTTLRELDELHTVSDPDQSIALDETLAQLRTATVDIDPNTSFVVTGTETAETLRIPVSTVRSMSGALAEALRNSHLHAGPRTTRTVTAALQADSNQHRHRRRRKRIRPHLDPPTPPGHRRQHSRTNATHRRWISAGGLRTWTWHHRAHRMDGAMTDDRTASRAKHQSSDTRDVRELLGLRTTAATVVVGAFIATFLLLALTTAPTANSLWAETSAWMVVSAAAITLIRTAGDPLPYRITLALTLAGPISLNLVFAVVPIPIDGLLQLWPLSAATAIYTYMCVRGRTVWAWLGMTANLGKLRLVGATNRARGRLRARDLRHQPRPTVDGDILRLDHPSRRPRHLRTARTNHHPRRR